MSTPYAPNPFDIATVLKLRAIEIDVEEVWEGFQFDRNLENGTFHLAAIEEKSLPDLEAGLFELRLDTTPIPSLDASSLSDYATADEDSHEQDVGPDEVIGDDVWFLPDVAKKSTRPVLISWDHFLHQEHSEVAAAYLSEAGNRVFDAVVAKTSTVPARRVKTDVYLDALYALALGESSVLFSWNGQDSSFTQNTQNVTISGAFPETLKEVTAQFVGMGSILRKLQQPIVLKSISPAKVAFRASVCSILAAIECYLELQRIDVNSVLSLQWVCGPAHVLLLLMDEHDTAVIGAHSDISILQAVIVRCKDQAVEHPQFAELLHNMISAMSMPILHRMASDIGLPTCMSYTALAQEPATLFGGSNLQQTADEARMSLKFLRNAAPERLLLFDYTADTVELHIVFSWDALNAVQYDAMQYEVDMKRRLLTQTTVEEDTQQPVITISAPESLTEDPSSHLAWNSDFALARSEPFAKDQLQATALRCLQSNDQPSNAMFALPIGEALELSISPLVYAQHRLLSYCVLDHLFRKCNLQAHFQLLHQVHLFGNGTFATRLSLALFDDQLASGEGRRRTGMTTGLRLQTRDTWPPASSELRLVLMGILSESLKSAGMFKFEDSISFAIRDLSDEELEAFPNVDSIHALDFLKLQYKPDNEVLGAVLTTEILEKYDRIFRHILRVLRLRSVAQSLLRSHCPRGTRGEHTAEHKFCISIQHFITVVADYSHNIAIGHAFGRLKFTLMQIEDKLIAKDYNVVLQHGKSLAHLRQVHENTLEEILRALFLKQKESKALLALEGAMDVVLRYASVLRRVDADEERKQLTKETFGDFTKHVSKFVEQVRLAAEREGMRDDHTDGDFEPFTYLLLMLDFGQRG